MNCLYCNMQNPPGAQNCTYCGKPLPRYAAPEGFNFNPGRGLYFRPHGERKTLFFDPVTGQYNVEEMPVPVYGAPEGFTYDSSIDRYICITQVDNVVRTMIFNQYSGEYAVTEESVPVVPPVAQEYAQMGYPVPNPQNQHMPSQRFIDKKPLIAALCVVLVAALGVTGWALWRNGVFGNSSEDDIAVISDVSEENETESEVPEDLNENTAVIIEWQEPLIEQAILDYLGKPEGGITDGDLSGINTIFMFGDVVAFNDNEPSIEEISQGTIKSLTDIANFPNLGVVISIGNPIETLEPLADVSTLHQVTVQNAQLSDVSPLKYLPVLTDLHLSNNNISDISSLAECTKLEYVSLDGNAITDASPLAELPNLWILFLNDNPIEDWSVVEHIENLYGMPEISDWAAVYAGVLRAEDYSYGQFDFFGNITTLMYFYFDGYRTIVSNVLFYTVPGFDEPVMVLSCFSPLADNPDKIDTFQYSLAFFMEDGEIRSALGTPEYNEIFTTSEISDYLMVNGDELARFEVGSASISQTEEDVRAALQTVHDWLEEQ